MKNRLARRTCDEAFKLQVVKMVREQNPSVPQVCRDMILTDSAVRRWAEQYDAESAGQPVNRPGFELTPRSWTL